MSDYSMKELEEWNKRIEEIVHSAGLDCFEQEFEIVSIEDMIGYESYIGMPSHYPHWSFGKSFERIKTLNKYNLSGLPYEMVINANPCIAYLMKDNTLLLQILTIAHVYGHNDFFKNNRLFKTGTRAEYTVEMFKNHANRIREYISDPGIGYVNVERVLNAAHALRFQGSRVAGERNFSEKQKTENLLEKMRKPESEFPLLNPKENTAVELPDFKKIPLAPEEDILLFILMHGRLNEWEKDIISIVRDESKYFLPQIETKIMNEGWASFWHYEILNRLELPQKLHFEFLKRHNQVICPHVGGMNPYFIGFKIFEDIKMKYSHQPQKMFEVREMERDQSFLRRYLTFELCKEMNLFEYEKQDSDYIISEVSDEEGWKKIRDTLASTVGMGGIPVIKVMEWIQTDNTLVLEHMYEGRELELNYANETLKHLSDLWNGKIMLTTVMGDKRKVILCENGKKITLINA